MYYIVSNNLFWQLEIPVRVLKFVRHLWTMEYSTREKIDTIFICGKSDQLFERSSSSVQRYSFQSKYMRRGGQKFSSNFEIGSVVKKLKLLITKEI